MGVVVWMQMDADWGLKDLPKSASADDDLLQP